MSRFCLDTSAYGHFKHGTPVVVELIEQAEVVALPTVVLGELRMGFRLGSRGRRSDAELDAFLGSRAVTVLVVDEACSRVYAEIVADLRAAGTPLPTNDIWIAAAAAREGLTVLTFDAHFERIARVGSRVLRA